jgi:hypothetical protein
VRVRSMVDGSCWRVRLNYVICTKDPPRDIPGMLRFPRNLINGVRSACAAEARRALVANILRTDDGIDELAEGAGRKVSYIAG